MKSATSKRGSIIANQRRKSNLSARTRSSYRGNSSVMKSTIERKKRRRFLFDIDALNSGASMHDLLKESQKKEENFHDIVDRDQGQVDLFIQVELVGELVESLPFRMFILVLIIINSVIIGIQTDEQLAEEYENLFNVFDQMVLTVFTMEILLKWYYGFFLFWKDGWNIFDFVIVAALFLGPKLTFLSSGRSLRIMRVVRAVRAIRSIHIFAGLHMVVQTTLHSLPDMVNICILLLIILSVFGVMGVTMFGSYIPQSWGNLPKALYSMFVCVTQDGWVDLLREFQSKGDILNVTGSFFLFVSVLIGAFIFANLVIAAICTNLEETIKEVKLEEKILKMESAYNDSNTPKVEKKMLEIVSLRKFRHKIDFTKQTPMLKTDLKELTVEKLENYLLLLHALEENLAEYLEIKNDLNRLYNVVQKLNVSAKDDAEPDDDLALDDEISDFNIINKKYASTLKARRNTAVSMKSDILSTMMSLQEQGVLNVSENQFRFKDMMKGFKKNTVDAM